MLPSQRALFDIPRDVCFLNAASWSPLPIAAQEAGRIGVARKGRPWLIEAGFAATQHERARQAAARLINADARGRRADLVGELRRRQPPPRSLPVAAGARVLVLADDHSSAVLEWITRADRRTASPSRSCRSPATATGPRPCSRRSNGRARRRVALASISSVHWSDGGIVDLDRVAAALRAARRGARWSTRPMRPA